MKVGVALGSGAAKGWAHIGVLEELEAMGIKIEAVAGCSIGALVGGIYSLGRLQQLKEWALALTAHDTAALLIEPHWGSGGVFRGQRIFHHLNELHFNALIEELPCPFGAVAVDMQTGEEVWIRQGRLLDAVRGSAAIPGLITPAFHQQRWLLDGALVNPVPVSLARAMGCDYVIAVDLNGPGLADYAMKGEGTKETVTPKTSWWERVSAWIGGRAGSSRYEEQPGYGQVLWSASSIMHDRVIRYRRVLERADVELRPDLPDLCLLEFHAAEKSIERGREAVWAQRDLLKKLTVKKRRKAKSPSQKLLSQLGVASESIPRSSP